MSTPTPKPKPIAYTAGFDMTSEAFTIAVAKALANFKP